MTSLYELTGALSELVRAAEWGPEDGSEPTPEQQDEWLAKIEAEMQTVSEHVEDKIEACGRMLRQLEADEAALAGEEQRFRARRKAVGAHGERLKRYMTSAILTLVELDAKGRRRVQTQSFLAWVQKNPPAVDVDGCSTLDLDERFVEYVPKVKAGAIMEHVRATGEVPKGAALRDERWHLRLK